MNPAPAESQVKLYSNKDSFDKMPVKSKYTGMSETFGQWLIRQRRALGLNQTEFAKRVGVTKATLSLYEKDGVDQPRLKQLTKIARALGKPVDEVRRAAFPASANESHDILDGVTIMFQNASALTPEQKERLLEMARVLARGIIEQRDD